MVLDAAPLAYDRRTILLHWLTAVLVIALWAAGQTIDWFPKGDPRVFARSGHILVGCVLLVVLAMRIHWRAGPGRRLPPADAGGIAVVARATHVALYVLLSTTVVLGVANALVRGDNILNLYRIPSIAPGDNALRGLIEAWHGLSANILLGVAAFHAAAGLFHFFVRRDRVLARMMPSMSK